MSKEEEQWELEYSNCYSYLPLPLSFLPSLVSSPSLHRIAVPDGTGLTGRGDLRKLSLLVLQLRWLLIRTRIHTQASSSWASLATSQGRRFIQHGAEKIRSEQTLTHTRTHAQTYTSNKPQNFASVVVIMRLENCLMFKTLQRSFQGVRVHRERSR